MLGKLLEKVPSSRKNQRMTTTYNMINIPNVSPWFIPKDERGW
jgi:hypothetical protein